MHLQEARQLSRAELDLRAELKGDIFGLASLVRTMAWQRARSRHIKEGDACTKYFHLQACHRRRKNYMFAIQHGGQNFTEKEAKAGVVFNYYNDLIGSPFDRWHRFDLDALGLPRLDLSDQAAPFTDEKVTRIVHETPSDRALGPDGFSGAFYKVAWEVVRPDVVRAFHALWAGDFRSFEHLNAALMVLLHKTEHPEGLRDYRPISLIHSVGKLFAKGLAMRLATCIPELVQPNQSAFIRGRRIHENFKTVQITCRWLHARRQPAMLLKVDLAKAFDTVAWPFLLDVLEHMGFPMRWRDWVSAMLHTASTRVLINGRPGRRIRHARGLRQGDPLSPFLFVIAMEVLNALFAEADHRALLSPLPGNKIKCRASIYAADLVIFLKPSPQDFAHTRRILDMFAGASSLTTNYDKCTITPIRCIDEAIAAVQQVFPCSSHGCNVPTSSPSSIKSPHASQPGRLGYSTPPAEPLLPSRLSRRSLSTSPFAAPYRHGH